MNDRQKHTLLCIDDDKNILSSLKRILQREGYEVLTSSSCAEALDILKSEHDIHIMLCEQKMPEMSGTAFYAEAMGKYPDIVRIVLTGFADIDAISESINQGHIYKIILKPWNEDNLKLEIKQAAEHYELTQSNKRLTLQTIEQNEKLISINENLERMVQNRVEDIEIQNKSLLFSQTVFNNLPLPAISINKEGFIALLSRSAENLPLTTAINVGDNLTDCFPADLTDALLKQLQINEPYSFKHIKIGTKTYDIYFEPISGSFEGEGGVVLFV
jgi:FixJ family two-component response regulator